MSFALPSTRSSCARPGPCARRRDRQDRRRRAPLRSSRPERPARSTARRRRACRAVDLDDGAVVAQTWRKRRIVSPEPARAEQQSRADQNERVEGERERVDVVARIQRAGVEQRRQRDLLAEDQQDHGADRPGESAEQALEHERPAHEPVRRADELHHLDLTPAREDRETDRVRDQQCRCGEQEDDGDDEEHLDHVRKL